MTNKMDVIGKRFDNMVVIKEMPRSGKYIRRWLCKCDCGKLYVCNTREVTGSNPKIKSCGCKNYSFHKNTKYMDAKTPSYKGLYNRCKQTAKNRGIEFSISFEKAKEMFVSECFYCGAKYSTTYNVYMAKSGSVQRGITKERAKQAEIKYNGIDRVDSSLGYVDNNVVPCCKICNFAKNDLSIDDFKNWITRVYERWVKNEDCSN